jgi:hypothetical protein
VKTLYSSVGSFSPFLYTSSKEKELSLHLSELLLRVKDSSKQQPTQHTLPNTTLSGALIVCLAVIFLGEPPTLEDREVTSE